jgi:hypothetical protein
MTTISVERERIERAVENTVAAIHRRRAIVEFNATDDEVRYIARKAVYLAFGWEQPETNA